LKCIKGYIHFIRLGHPDGVVRLGPLWNRVNQIARDHGVAPLATNLVKSCFFSQPRPRHWPGGEGKAVAGIHQNATPILNARRLHQAWQIVLVELPLLMIDEGHEIGNHTYYHPNLALCWPEHIRLELNATQLLLETITGRATTLFRPPYAADSSPTELNDLTPLKIAEDLNYLVVLESIDPQDWAKPGADVIV